MNYLYYPGCSLKGTGKAYEESLLAVFDTINVLLEELEDWNCCGATAYMSISELKAFALSARNFALAERQNRDTGTARLLVPCAACYLGLNKAQRYLNEYPELFSTVKEALDEADLILSGPISIRHPLDVIYSDIGLKTIKDNVVRPLQGLKFACYYGCQIVRPYADFDDQFKPYTMDRIVQAVGAEAVDWPLKTRCCGGSLTGTIKDVGLRLSYILISEAKKRGCDMIATACPLCQFNLECYQKEMRKLYRHELDIPIVYFTQIIGMALGIDPHKLGLHRLFMSPLTAFQMRATSGGVHVRN
ncbi:MAG: CoB--CoM heterodisulfide reductase iron-sulfur subunit B family protein [Candidatus Zixiibacteriota bacterium]|nr:MAG: CoB--CoM heterodisulfide reductase iron-sulfur subunit B family protein [candidate division Zixibacteria bacterium]